MKRLLIALSFLPSLVYGAGNQVGLTVSSGTFQSISTYANNDGAQRQAIVIGDVTSSTTLTVDSIKGIPVYVSTGTSAIGSVIVSTGGVSSYIIGGSIGNTSFQATQPNAYNVVSTSTILGTGSAAIGSITNTGFTANQPNAYNVVSTSTVLGTGSAAIGSITNTTFGATQAAAYNVVSTNTITTISTSTVSGVAGSTIAVVNAAGTTLAISGSITSSAVNITTAPFAGTFPVNGSAIFGIGANGNPQTFAVDSSSRVQITGSITSTSVNITTTSYDGAFPGVGSALVYVGPTGLAQSPRVDISSNTLVVLSAGSSAIGSITNTTFGATQAAAFNVVSTNTVLGTGSNAIGSITNTTFGATQAAAYNVVSTNTVLGAGSAAIGTVAQGAAGTVDWRVTSSTAATTPRVLVSSSNALPTGTADAGSAQILGDTYGRMITLAGVPSSVVLSTQPAAITGTGYTVLLASPSASTFSHLCGCTVFNTSATDTYVTIYPSGASTTSNFFRIAAPKANFNSGIWPGCDKPFLNTTAGGVQVTAVAAASVSSLFLQCQYFQSTVP